MFTKEINSDFKRENSFKVSFQQKKKIICEFFESLSHKNLKLTCSVANCFGESSANLGGLLKLPVWSFFIGFIIY